MQRKLECGAVESDRRTGFPHDSSPYDCMSRFKVAATGTIPNRCLGIVLSKISRTESIALFHPIELINSTPTKHGIPSILEEIDYRVEKVFA